jgi:hypothetical protein
MFQGLDQVASSDQVQDRIRQIVAQADRDNSGSLDVEEFVVWYESVYEAELDGEAKRIFAKLDKDGSGSLDREELKVFVQQVLSYALFGSVITARWIVVFLALCFQGTVAFARCSSPLGG